MKDYNYSESDIQKYILDELTQEEVLQFEAAMKKNPEFALEVNKQQKIADGIAHYGAQKFKSRTKDIYAEVRPQIISKVQSKKNPLPWLKIIISTIALFLLLFLLDRNFNSPAKMDSSTIYATYYQSYDWNPNLRNDEAQDFDLDNAAEFYSSGSYNQAIPLLKNIIDSSPNNITSRLALASSYLETDNAQLAIPLLNNILNQDDVLYKYQVNWYLGMAYLKLNRLDDAKKIFQKLALNPEADYFEESRAIIENLN